MNNNKPPLEFRTGSHKPSAAPAPGLNMAIANIADYAFNIGALVSIDMTSYKEGAEGRIVVIRLVGDVSHTFQGDRADAAFYWYLQLTGQARVEGA